MLNSSYYKNIGLDKIYNKVINNERLTKEDGITLYKCNDLFAIGALAMLVRTNLHNDRTFYVVNRQINYTNVCVNDCKFCAFRRDHESDNGAFHLSKEEILDKIIKANNSLNLDEIHIVGGCHPDLKLSWFEDLLSTIHNNLPHIPIKAFTPVEIAHFATLNNISTIEVLKRFKNVGLSMLPGGGAEIFDQNLRKNLCPKKADAKTWLNISQEAHSLGIKSNSTMLFGHIETIEQRIDHLIQLREQQDKSHGFTCFIPLPFLTKNSKLQLLDDKCPEERGIDQLKTIAISRLMLDNIPHIKAYWIMLGAKLAQTALHFGADDIDGTIVEEHIGHMAGAISSQGLTIKELITMIQESGFTPIRRNATFEEQEI